MNCYHNSKIKLYTVLCFTSRQKRNQRNYNIPREWFTLFFCSSGTAKYIKKKTFNILIFFQRENRWQDSTPLMPIWALFPWIVGYVSVISCRIWNSKHNRGWQQEKKKVSLGNGWGKGKAGLQFPFLHCFAKATMYHVGRTLNHNGFVSEIVAKCEILV